MDEGEAAEEGDEVEEEEVEEKPWKIVEEIMLTSKNPRQERLWKLTTRCIVVQIVEKAAMAMACNCTKVKTTLKPPKRRGLCGSRFVPFVGELLLGLKFDLKEALTGLCVSFLCTIQKSCLLLPTL